MKHHFVECAAQSTRLAAFEVAFDAQPSVNVVIPEALEPIRVAVHVHWNLFFGPMAARRCFALFFHIEVSDIEGISAQRRDVDIALYG